MRRRKSAWLTIRSRSSSAGCKRRLSRSALRVLAMPQRQDRMPGAWLRPGAVPAPARPTSPSGVRRWMMTGSCGFMIGARVSCGVPRTRRRRDRKTMSRWGDEWWEHAPSRPRKARGGIKARSQAWHVRRDCGGGRRWLAALERLSVGGRLQRRAVVRAEGSGAGSDNHARQGDRQGAGLAAASLFGIDRDRNDWAPCSSEDRRGSGRELAARCRADGPARCRLR